MATTTKARPSDRLISVHLVKRRDDEGLDDILGHFFWQWTYPTIDPTVRCFIEKRLYSKSIHPSGSTDNFDFYKLGSSWVYVQPAMTDRHFFILLTSDFCPYTYQKILVTFTSMFTVAKLSFRGFLHYYLSLIIAGSVTITELSFQQLTLLQLEPGDTAPVRRSHIKAIIKLFHLDVILIYTALLLKRKIAIYHHCQSTLLDFSAALSAFVSHRPEATTHQVLYPNVDLHLPEQCEHLSTLPHFIGTFTDGKIEERTDLYDIYVNLAAVEITISHKAREMFSMTKTHKEVAIALVRVAESESTTSEDVIAEIAKKTTELRQSLAQFSNNSGEHSPDTDSTKISKAKLKQKLLSPNLESFYWNLAVAEGIAQFDVE